MPSLFEVEKSEVIRVANIIIEAIHVKRQALLEEKIDKYMKRKLFRPKTRDDAERRIRNKAECFGKYEPFLDAGRISLMQARDLLDACSICKSETIFLSCDDAAFIARWR